MTEGTILCHQGRTSHKVTCGQRPKEVRIKSVDIQREKERKYKTAKLACTRKVQLTARRPLRLEQSELERER